MALEKSDRNKAFDPVVAKNLLTQNIRPLRRLSNGHSPQPEYDLVPFTSTEIDHETTRNKIWRGLFLRTYLGKEDENGVKDRKEVQLGQGVNVVYEGVIVDRNSPEGLSPVAVKVNAAIEKPEENTLKNEAEKLALINRLFPKSRYFPTLLGNDEQTVVIEAIEGHKLSSEMIKTWIAQDPIVRTQKLLKQISTAIHLLHAQDIINQDIKDDNILVSIKGENCQVTLIDFGVAHVKGEKERFISTTPGFGPLESYEGYLSIFPNRIDQKLLHKIDIFSLGVVSYQVLFGQLPIGINNVYDKRRDEQVDAIDNKHRFKMITLEKLDILVGGKLHKLGGYQTTDQLQTIVPDNFKPSLEQKKTPTKKFLLTRLWNSVTREFRQNEEVATKWSTRDELIKQANNIALKFNILYARVFSTKPEKRHNQANEFYDELHHILSELKQLDNQLNIYLGGDEG